MTITEKQLSRRNFLEALGVAGAATALTTSMPSARAAQDANKKLPNIVYILADDMGYGDVGCLNPDSKIPTPNMDKLGKNGMIFTDAHSGSAVCTPTRYGIITGRYCWRSPLKSGVLWGYSPPLIEPQRTTVASLLKSQGYRTAGIGKWHLGLGWATSEGKEANEGTVDYSRPIKGGPTDLGFDYFFGIPASLDMDPYVYVENDHVVEAPTEHVEKSKGLAFYREGPVAPGFKHKEVLPKFTQKATEVIDTHADEYPDSPLFMYMPLAAPHTPILPNKDFVGKSGLGDYGDFVCEVDWAVGQVVEALTRNGMLDNTLLIVTSDNGCSPMADFKHLESQGHDPSYHFRGHKADIFEGGHRIPFIAQWPAHIPAGTTCDHITCLTDLTATAAAITGVSLPDNVGEDSVSMLPALANPDTKPAREAIVHHSINGSFSIRKGKWKLEFCPGSGGWSYPRPKEAKKKNLPPVQLYDLSADIGEQKNLHEKYPEVVERLTKLMEKYIADGRSTPGTPQHNEGKTPLWKS